MPRPDSLLNSAHRLEVTTSWWVGPITPNLRYYGREWSLTGLTSDQRYEIAVQAINVNGGGACPPSSPSPASAPPPTTPPSRRPPSPYRSIQPSPDGGRGLGDGRLPLPLGEGWGDWRVRGGTRNQRQRGNFANSHELLQATMEYRSNYHVLVTPAVV